MRLLDIFRRQSCPTPGEVRDQMKRDDPDFAHVSAVHHDAQGLIGASQNARQMAERIADGRALRQEAEFWARHGDPDKGKRGG